MSIDLLIQDIKRLFSSEGYSFSVPLTLYHYCNANALFNILKDKQIYLSDIRGMNDYSEMDYGKQLINSVARSENKTQLIKDIEFEINTSINEPFVFCLSAERKLLSQWITYAEIEYDGESEWKSIADQLYALPVYIVPPSPFLNEYGFDNVDLRKCGIPYRNNK